MPEKVLRKFTLIDRHSPGLNEQSPISSPTMPMPIHGHPSIDGSTGSAGSRESSPADSPAYLYPQDILTHQSYTQEQIQFSPEISLPAVREMSVLRHNDVIYSNSSHSHLPLRKRPYVNAVTNHNQQPIRNVLIIIMATLSSNGPMREPYLDHVTSRQSEERRG